MNVSEELGKRARTVDELLKRYLPSADGYQKTVLDAMNYSVMAGGKRLRPVLMQECFRLFEGTDDSLLAPFMAAIEMIHTYSLVHDDLPAMDNDEYRRGRKTTHVVYGEDMGILCGDALLNYAYETAAEAFSLAFTEMKLRRVARAMQVLTRKAGVFGMVGGQVVDVESNGQVPELEMLQFICRLKTGALIEASMMIGAILAGADEADVSKMEQIASKVGIAFQIQDDILDVTSTTEELGKPVHSDEKNDKTTSVTFLGLEKAQSEVKRYTQEAIGILQDCPASNPFLCDLLIWLVERKK